MLAFVVEHNRFGMVCRVIIGVAVIAGASTGYPSAVFTSPAVKPGVKFLYFDPLLTLSESVRQKWLTPKERDQIISAALDRVQL